MELINERLFYKDMVGLSFFSLNESILYYGITGLLSVIFACSCSSSLASLIVRVLGEPLFCENKLSVMNS